ncbi:Calcium-binding protein [Microcystis aeruginosa]
MAISFGGAGSYWSYWWRDDWYYDRTVVSDNGSDTLRGWNNCNDYLIGNGGNDNLVGYSGSDILQGSSNFSSSNNEIDTLNGSWENTTPDGYSDLFVLGNASGNLYRGTGFAIIQNFELGLDAIQLKAGSGGDGGLGIIVEKQRHTLMGGGTSATDTLIKNASNGNLLAVIQDQAYSFNELYHSFEFV